jgi:DNA invertase Pin-like site-specific DNA recombinase
MNHTKLKMQNLRQSPLPQRLVENLLQATTYITLAKAESGYTPLKRILNDIMFVDEVRYLNAYYGKDYSCKDILLAPYTKTNKSLSEHIELIKSCIQYAEVVRSTYKILPATDFLKINEALITNDATILDNPIDSKLIVLVDDMWKILNEVYSPESDTPLLLRMALMWLEMEERFFDAPIHIFAKTMILNLMLHDSFEISHRSLFITKRIITRRPQIKTVEGFVSVFLKVIEDAAFDKISLIIELNHQADKVREKISEKLPKMCSENVMRMFGENLILNNTLAEKSLCVSVKTAISYLKRFEEAGLLKSERVGHDIYYLNVYLLNCMYRAGIYARISVDEGENQSIDTQISIALEYIKKDYTTEYIKTYKDIGCSSYAPIRPAYEEMMSDAVAGVINCIVVKDLSRLGRNYINTGFLLESIFPSLGVRCISVVDGYDSNVRGHRDTVEMPLKSLLNHIYSADISVKVKSTFKIKIENGTYVSAYAPFGYKKVKSNQKIIYKIDESAAEYVRTIFNLALSGMSIYQITGKLNGNISSRVWTQRYVGRILRNSFYTGTYVAGKTDSFFIRKEKRKRPEEEWTIVENHHPAIIDKEVFKLVGEKINKNTPGAVYKKVPIENRGVLDSTMFCGSCGRKLKKIRRTLKNGDSFNYHFCPYHSETAGGGCRHNSIREDRLKAEIWR